jgi:uncharacterized protein
MTQLLTRADVARTYVGPSWQRVLFSEFEATLTSSSRPFPCTFGVSGLKSDQLRYIFLDPFSPETLAPALRAYLSCARSIGRMTSLVAFGRPGPVQCIEAYRERFWALLDGLEAMDDTLRPEGFSRNLDDATWEFCFAGEPIFVVCNTPAHVLRQSRRSTGFMVTFQPRWVFEGITDTDEPRAQRALASVRRLLHDFDAIEPAPFLGKFGDPENREFRQYFIDDTNDAPQCPFHRLGESVSDDQATKGKVA